MLLLSIFKHRIDLKFHFDFERSVSKYPAGLYLHYIVSIYSGIFKKDVSFLNQNNEGAHVLTIEFILFEKSDLSSLKATHFQNFIKISAEIFSVNSNHTKLVTEVPRRSYTNCQ